MQSSHPVAQAWKQSHLLLQEASDSASEVLHRRIDQRDYQNLLTFLQARGDELGSEVGKRPSLAAAGHGSDPHAPSRIVQYLELLRAWLEHQASLPENVVATFAAPPAATDHVARSLVRPGR